MKIDYLKVQNFMLYKKGKWKFKDKDIIGILAEYTDNPNKSNRAGKCFGKGTPIRMFDGSVKPVEKVKNGQKVMGPDSKHRVVSGVTTGKEEMFEVVSHDETIKFTCNRSHILTLKPSCRIKIFGKTYGKSEVINISIDKYINLAGWKKPMLNLYRSNAIEFEQKSELPLDPYVLGVWLGDGACAANKVTIADKEIFDYLEQFSKDNNTNFNIRKLRQKNGEPYWDVSLTGRITGRGDTASSTSVVSRVLKELNLYNNKHIPDIYLKASIKDRLQLLAGLLDTDSHLSKDRLYEIISKYDKLNSGIIELCRSLGLAVTTRKKPGSINGKLIGYYNRTNIFGDIRKIPCKVERKRTDFFTTKRDVLRKSFIVKSIGRGKYYGFQVNKDSLFLLSDYTVVHNTSILEAMKYVLTGRTRAKKKTQLIHFGEEVMMVEMGLIDDDGKTFKIKRGIDYKNHALLECDWIDKSREAQRAIDELIGCDGKEFELTNFFKQSEINQFMELSPPEKQKYAMKWFNNTHWIELSKNVGKDLSDKEKELTKLRIKKETIGEELGDKKKLLSSIKKLKAKIDIKELKLINYRTKRRKIESKLMSEDEQDDLSEQIDSVEEEINDIEHRLDTQEETKNSISKLKAKKVKLKKKISKLPEYTDSDYKDVINTLHEAKSISKQVKKKLGLVETEFCGICPVLNEGCDRIKKNPKEIKQWKSQVKELDEVCQEAEEEIGWLESAKDLQAGLKATTIQVIQLKRGLTPTKSLAKKRGALKAKFEDLTACMDKAQDAKHSQLLDSICEKIQKIKLGLDGLNQDLGQYQSNLVRIKKAKSRISKIDDSILVLDKEIKDLKYLAFMFGKSGIPSQEIENAFQGIEDEVNFILEKFNTAMEVSFNADKETNEWEEDCVGCGWRFPKGYRQKTCEECGEDRLKKRKDELHLTVLENGNESTFESESGGGKFFISFAVRIALTMLKQRQTGSTFKVLFLDEVDSALDQDARGQLMKMVKTILIKQFGFLQVFWVSHNDAITQSVPYTLKVLRKKKSAVAQWV